MFLKRPFGAGQFFVPYTVRYLTPLARNLIPVSFIVTTKIKPATHISSPSLEVLEVQREATLLAERHYT